MNEEISLRIEALRFAIKLSGDHYEDVYEDVFPLATSVYKFLKGETPNE